MLEVVAVQKHWDYQFNEQGFKTYVVIEELVMDKVRHLRYIRNPGKIVELNCDQSQQASLLWGMVGATSYSSIWRLHMQVQFILQYQEWPFRIYL